MNSFIASGCIQAQPPDNRPHGLVHTSFRPLNAHSVCLKLFPTNTSFAARQSDAPTQAAALVLCGLQHPAGLLLVCGAQAPLQPLPGLVTLPPAVCFPTLPAWKGGSEWVPVQAGQGSCSLGPSAIVLSKSSKVRRAQQVGAHWWARSAAAQQQRSALSVVPHTGMHATPASQPRTDLRSSISAVMPCAAGQGSRAVL